MSSSLRIVVWYAIRPQPSEDMARTTFIHLGMAVAVAGTRRAIARHENE